MIFKRTIKNWSCVFQNYSQILYCIKDVIILCISCLQYVLLSLLAPLCELTTLISHDCVSKKRLFKFDDMSSNIDIEIGYNVFYSKSTHSVCLLLKMFELCIFWVVFQQILQTKKFGLLSFCKWEKFSRSTGWTYALTFQKIKTVYKRRIVLFTVQIR